MTQAIEQAVCDILGACQPVKIILYAEKRTMATDKLKAFSLCRRAPTAAHCAHTCTWRLRFPYPSV